jgi:flagellar basal body rod protein FlgC
MPVTGSTITTALNALKTYTRRVDTDAQSIAADGLYDPQGESTGSAGTPAPPAAGTQDLAGAMTDMLIAQRLFAAQLRVLQAADQMQQDTVNLVKK